MDNKNTEDKERISRMATHDLVEKHHEDMKIIRGLFQNSALLSKEEGNKLINFFNSITEFEQRAALMVYVLMEFKWRVESKMDAISVDIHGGDKKQIEAIRESLKLSSQNTDELGIKLTRHLDDSLPDKKCELMLTILSVALNVIHRNKKGSIY
ncbi:MAG: hypothetical protein PHE59_03220 [Patescibacteria group bacterium]|nr:hypothetical protein [Patescibacteria group bacterium]MDD5164840.1 hypothetical protein [Patescibacteria group bacterium]MDD5534672.1 hypothetical protein [Patescibacteria group bacterium]